MNLEVLLDDVEKQLHTTAGTKKISNQEKIKIFSKIGRILVKSQKMNPKKEKIYLDSFK